MGMLRNKYVKFGIVAFVYLLWVIWVSNYWWLIGLAVIFDIYVTKKVHWAFWKKKGVEKQNAVVEWLDALIFAVVAASIIRLFFIEAFTIPTSSMEKSMLVGDYLFVSKASYGPKMQNTPLSFPFAHHTMPLTASKPSYLKWIQRPYKRIAGLGKVKNDDVVVFNFPEGDTVCVQDQAQSYYSIIRRQAEELRRQIKPDDSIATFRDFYGQSREIVQQRYDLTVRPVDKRENYIKRCVAIPGDTLQVVESQLYINGKPQQTFAGIQHNYIVKTNNALPYGAWDELGISQEDLSTSQRLVNSQNVFYLPLSTEKVEVLRKTSGVESVEKTLQTAGEWDMNIFPHHVNYKWNQDYFGPLVMPKKGVTIPLTVNNLPLYERLIDLYEDNDLLVKGDKIFINGTEVSEYTFKMDYYFLMGDNRHNSADSRFWGFVPEDHVVGKAVFVWLSLDKDKGWFSGKIRWSRLFSTVH